MQFNQNDIKVSCKATKYIELAKILPFQDNLKNLSNKNFEKLKNSILKHGLLAPFIVWKHENTYYLLDGHQRLRVLEILLQEGFKLEQVPIIEVVASSYQDAKQKLLSLASAYGEFDKDGLYQYLHENQLPPTLIEDFFVPTNFSFESFLNEYFIEQETIERKENKKHKLIIEGDFESLKEIQKIAEQKNLKAKLK
jgi:hypothetical protein